MNSMFALWDIGGGQILLILLLVLIFFGAKRIPELAKGLGQGIKEFKKATREVSDEIHKASDETSGDNKQPKQVSSATQTEKQTTVPQSPDQKT